MVERVCCTVLPPEGILYAYLKVRLPQWEAGGEAVRYSDRQILFYAGHIPTGVFLIRSGGVTWGPPTAKQKNFAPDCADRDVPLLGLSHFLSGASHCATCSADGSTDVVFFSKRQILDLLEMDLGSVSEIGRLR